MFKPLKQKLSQQGLTLVEVLVAMLATVAFVLTTMQLIVVAAAFSSKAQQYAAATNIIQQGVENLKARAAEYYPAGNVTICSAIPAGGTTPTATAGYGAGLQNFIGGPANTPTDSSIDDSLVLGGQAFRLTRTTEVYPTAPYSVLKVTYDIKPRASTTGTSIASLNTEIIPGAALQCPLFNSRG